MEFMKENPNCIRDYLVWTIGTGKAELERLEKELAGQ